MSEGTQIEWATHTFNPWIGCTKVSPGCVNCYAEHSTPTRVARKNGKELWGKGKARQRTSASYWKQPLKWNRDHQELIDDPNTKHFMERGVLSVERPRVFPSLCDWLDDEVPIEWLADFLKLIHDTPNLDWLLLSKRPENWRARIGQVVGKSCIDGCMPEDRFGMAGWLANRWQHGEAPRNVWIGTSVEDQTRADERIPALLSIPAAVRFLSVEPLLGAVELFLPQWNCLKPDIHWVIVGGESGPGARPCNVEWVSDIVRQCQAAGVPCFVKQLGSKPVVNTYSGDMGIRPENKRAFSSSLLLKHPKGGDPAEWPEDLRVRQFPLSHRGENADSK